MTTEAVQSPAFLQVEPLLREKTLNGQIDVPMLPEVAGKVVRLTQDPESDAIELSKLIQSDQSLAGHVMRVANSAAYSPNTTMVSLQQAITRLGMKVISEIALAASITSSLFDAPGFEKYIQHELRFSLATGLWSKEVARVCRKNVEAAFLAGLLHDIGRPVAIQASLSAASEIGADLTKDDVYLLESQYQRIIGSRVVEEWEMPASVISVVRLFDNYSRPHKGQDQTMVVVAGARFAHHFIGKRQGEDHLSIEELTDSNILADLNLYPDDIERILEKEELISSSLEVMHS